MSRKPSLPLYEPMLAAFHRGFAEELQAMVGILPIERGQSVLDMACGDGAYSPWLAERVGPTGRVVAVDLVSEYLKLARDESQKSASGGIIEFENSPIDSLPFEDGAFDLCWCAQSLYSLPNPVDTVRQLMRVTKPGGIVAVLETDTFHEVILPWPVEIELSVRAAELQSLVEGDKDHGKFYVGRRLRGVFRQAGLEAYEQRTFAFDRLAPFGTNERTFFAEYLNALCEAIEPYLDPIIRVDIERIIDPNSRAYLFDAPDATVTCIDRVVWGRKPVGPGNG